VFSNIWPCPQFILSFIVSRHPIGFTQINSRNHMDFRSNNIKNNQENVNSVAPPGRYSSSPGGSCKNQEQRPKFVMPPGGPGLAAGRFLGRNPGKQSNFIHTRHNSSYSVKNQSKQLPLPEILAPIQIWVCVCLQPKSSLAFAPTQRRFSLQFLLHTVQLLWKSFAYPSLKNSSPPFSNSLLSQN